MSEIDIEEIKFFQETVDYKRNVLFTEITTLKNIVKSRMKVYEGLEGMEPIETSNYADLNSYQEFLTEQINSLNALLSNYDDLVNSLGEIIKELDTKNTYKIEEILHMD